MKRIDRSSKVRTGFHQAKWDEPIIYELSTPGERGILVGQPEKAVAEEVEGEAAIPAGMARNTKLNLPEMSQAAVLRHYSRLAQQTLGADVNIEIGQGTCTVKYSPKVNDQLANLIREYHPLQDESTVQGMLQIFHETDKYMCEISGMDRFSFQPSGGSQGIMTMASLIRAYFKDKGEDRDEIITTIYSHPSDAAAPHVAGFKIIFLQPDPKTGVPDLEQLKAVAGPKTAGYIVANPEDTGVYNSHVKEFVDYIHSIGGLCAYDQANANGLLGVTRARDAGFDMCFFNLHKTFSSPHGSQGPGAGAQGCTEELAQFLPLPTVEFDGTQYYLDYNRPHSIGKLRKFYGVPAVVLRAYAYIRSLGADGLKQVSELAILNNNYLLKKLASVRGLSMPMAEGKPRLEQARLSWEKLCQETSVTTDDIDRRIVDYGFQSYFASHHPRIIPEPFTPEACETYSKADIEEYAAALQSISEEAYATPEVVKTAPHRAALATQLTGDRLDNMDTFACTWRAYQKQKNR